MLQTAFAYVDIKGKLYVLRNTLDFLIFKNKSFAVTFPSTSITLYLHSPHLTLEKEKERGRDLELASTDPIIARWVKLFSPSLFITHTHNHTLSLSLTLRYTHIHTHSLSHTHSHAQTHTFYLSFTPSSSLAIFYPPSKSHFHFFLFLFFLSRADQVITICFCSIINYVRLCSKAK